MGRVNNSELQLADVIFSREPSPQSMLIQIGSLSPFSHVLIYSGNNKIIQATGSGVTEDPLSYLRTHNASCEVYRHRAISRFQAAAVVRYCRDSIEQSYDFSNATLSVFGIDPPMNHAELRGFDTNSRERARNRLFSPMYCSQLIALAYECVGLPIVHPGQSIRSNPGTMRFAHALRYIGEYY